MTQDLDRYARQMAYPAIGEAGQRRILAGSVLVVGCGALGSAAANLLARAGVGRLRIVDRDYLELNNLQRQTLFEEEDVASGIPKAVAAANRLRRVNSGIEIQAEVAHVDTRNIRGLLRGVDIVVDGTDNFETRYLLNDACVKWGLPWVYGGVIGSYGISMTIRPGRSACLRCAFPEVPAPGSVDTCETAGVLGSAVNIVGAWQASETLKLLCGADDQLNNGLLSVDVWTNALRHLRSLERDRGCVTCGQGRFEFLESRASTRATALCGRDAVQVSPPEGVIVDLPTLANRLARTGKVAHNEYLLRFNAEGLEMTLFPDARAIIKGTDEEDVARAFYARYVGS